MPVSLLPLPSKLLEKAVQHQVTVYLDNNHLLDKKQHGFRAQYSTSTAICKVTQVLFKNFDSGNNTSCIFGDYKRRLRL